MTRKAIFLMIAVCAVAMVGAAVVPISPVGGEKVSLLPEGQIDVISLPTYSNRVERLKEKWIGKKDAENEWGVSRPLVLRWRVTDVEQGPWKIEIGKNEDLSDARVWLVAGQKPRLRGEQDENVLGLKLTDANLEIGQTYHWRIWSNVKCTHRVSCGSTLTAPCKCGHGKVACASPIATFTTDGQPPRWIALEGRVKNVRDIGGWRTHDGRLVKQGMAFRGQGLNDDSVDGETAGKNRLTVEDVRYLKGTLKIRTDLDLRTPSEVAGMAKSPLGDGVRFIHHPSPAYAGLFSEDGKGSNLADEGKKTMAANFRIFCDEKNYPIFFHCIGGTDRTGSLAYVLNAVLGVDRHDLEVDWESTLYPDRIPELKPDYSGKKGWRSKEHFDVGFAKYGNENTSWNDRVVSYLLDCGITKAEIERFRSIMLEQQGTNYTVAVNLGFENGNEGWLVPKPTWRVEDGAGRQGSKGLVWENANPDAYSFPAQRVVLEGGGVYRFGCWVKVDSLQKDGKKTKTSVSLDWSDADGKWISAAYAHPVVGNETDTDGWVRFEGVTSPLPDAATQGNLLCFLPKGATGKVRFDDFSFKPEAVRMVDLLCSSAYRDTATDGMASFRATLYLNLVKHPLDTIEPLFSYTEADGTAVLAAPDEMSPQFASITRPVDKMAKGRQQVSFILKNRADGQELGRAECAFTRAEAFSPRVRFDEHKRTLVDGKPFLPLGMYASNLSAETIATYTNGVFNCIMPYNASRDQLDAAYAAGLKVIYSVKDMVWGGTRVRKGCETREKSLKAIREEVEAVKNHPALLAWYVNDESPESQIATLREVNALIHELDPDHPTWAVTDKPWHVRPFLGSYDCIGMDPYPIGNHRGGIEIAAGWALEARKGSFDIVPMWHVPQAFNWRWYRRTVQDPGHRFPTRQELDSMFWQAIAAGANGLIPYAFHAIQKNLKGAEFEKAMNDVVAVMSAVKRRVSLILSDPGPSAVSEAKNLFCRTWRTKNDECWLLISNANRERISATVKFGEEFAAARAEDGIVAALSATDVLSVKLESLVSGFVRLEPQNLKR